MQVGIERETNSDVIESLSIAGGAEFEIILVPDREVRCGRGVGKSSVT
jgi:hypothetical protein